MIEWAPAKLTRYLHITGTRPDGYHLIEAEMVSLDLCDELHFANGDSLDLSGPHARGLSNGDDNLVRRALALGNVSAAVRLTKNIPARGGLGGGSSDAAAALRYCGVLDLDLACRLGADVPFCLRGGRAFVAGVGEKVEGLTHAEHDFTLLVPPFGVDTAAVYRAYDDHAGAQGDHNDANHLEAAALAVEARLRPWRDLMAEATGQRPILAGSGSTWFVEGHFEAPDGLGEARWLPVKSRPGIGEPGI